MRLLLFVIVAVIIHLWWKGSANDDKPVTCEDRRQRIGYCMIAYIECSQCARAARWMKCFAFVFLAVSFSSSFRQSVHHHVPLNWMASCRCVGAHLRGCSSDVQESFCYYYCKIDPTNDQQSHRHMTRASAITLSSFISLYRCNNNSITDFRSLSFFNSTWSVYTMEWPPFVLYTQWVYAENVFSVHAICPHMTLSVSKYLTRCVSHERWYLRCLRLCLYWSI